MSEDNLLFHDPGLKCILLIDFEMFQLDLCFFFSWPKTFYVKQLPDLHNLSSISGNFGIQDSPGS